MSAVPSDVAPGRLDSIRLLVNSLDYPSGPDELATTEAAAAWCREHGLSPPTNPAECERLRAFREALRELLLTNNGEGDAEQGWRRLEPFAAASRLRVRVDPHRGPVLEPAGEGDAAIAQLLAIVYDAVGAGTWQRMRACRKASCKFAYYDRSKNGSRAWCSMAVCGNREKAHRRRAREHDRD